MNKMNLSSCFTLTLTTHNQNPMVLYQLLNLLPSENEIRSLTVMTTLLLMSSGCRIDKFQISG